MNAECKGINSLKLYECHSRMNFSLEMYTINSSKMYMLVTKRHFYIWVKCHTLDFKVRASDWCQVTSVKSIGLNLRKAISL